MRRALAAWVLVAGACSGGTGDDATPDADVIAAPLPPALPALAPCPPGWREVDDDPDAIPGCDPWPEGGQAGCAGDEAHFPGEPACARVGRACPAGEWAEDLPATGVLYVRAGGAAGGVGTMAAPFGTIAEAIAAAAAGTTIALGKGSYSEAVQVPGSVTLAGACVAETTVAATTFVMSSGTITIGGSRERADGGLRRGPPAGRRDVSRQRREPGGRSARDPAAVDALTRSSPAPSW